MECGAWSVMCGVWSVECGVLCVECGEWYVQSVVCSKHVQCDLAVLYGRGTNTSTASFLAAGQTLEK